MMLESTRDEPNVQGRQPTGLTGGALTPVSARDRSTEDRIVIATMSPQTCEYSPEVFEWVRDYRRYISNEVTQCSSRR